MAFGTLGRSLGGHWGVLGAPWGGIGRPKGDLGETSGALGDAGGILARIWGRWRDSAGLNDEITR